MTNPWDLPPFPTAGDKKEDLTHVGIGRTMDAWESVEFELCLIMAALKGDPKGEAMRLYGEKRSFPYRLQDFQELVRQHFVRVPDQEREGRISSLIEEVDNFSKRRNDVAHSIVLPINQIEFFKQHLRRKDRSPNQYAAIPPYHRERAHEDGLPMYAYTLPLMMGLRRELNNLLIRLRDYREQI